MPFQTVSRLQRSDGEPVDCSDFVIGLGSPHGDDAVAWRVVERLRDRFVHQVEVRALREPLQLLDLMRPHSRFWIVDACQSGAPLGTIHRLQWPDDRLQEFRASSTHSTSLASTLRLAEVLGKLPASVTILGIEVNTWLAAQTQLSPEACAAAMHLENLLSDELNTLTSRNSA